MDPNGQTYMPLDEHPNDIDAKRYDRAEREQLAEAEAKRTEAKIKALMAVDVTVKRGARR